MKSLLRFPEIRVEYYPDSDSFKMIDIPLIHIFKGDCIRVPFKIEALKDEQEFDIHVYEDSFYMEEDLIDSFKATVGDLTPGHFNWVITQEDSAKFNSTKVYGVWCKLECKTLCRFLIEIL